MEAGGCDFDAESPFRVHFSVTSFLSSLLTLQSLSCAPSDKLAIFISSKETNVRYLGLDTMAHLAARADSLEPIKQHQDTIIHSLRDKDLDDLVRACLHHDSQIQSFDTSCFSGQYITGDVTADYLNRLQEQRSDQAKARRRQVGKGALKAIRAV